MSEKITKFSLKRRKQLENTIFTDGKLYDVYRNDYPYNCDKWAFFIIDDNYTKHHFNMLDGQINNAKSQIVADYWEVVRLNDGGKTMETKQGFKVGDKVRVLAPTSAIKDKDENTFNKGDITHVSALHSYDQVRIGDMDYANIINTSKLERVKEPELPILKDGMVLVCTKEDKGYANFTEGKEYPVTLDGNGDPCFNSDGGTPYYDWEFEKLNGWGIEFTTKTVLSVPESDPLDDSTRSITVEGKSLGELYTNLRNAARAVKALENKKISFDSATDDLTDALVAYKKLGGK